MSSDPVGERRLGPGAAALALFIFALWGANTLAIKVSVEAVPPLAAAAIRFTLGLGFIVGTARLRGVSLRPAPGEWRALALLSLVFLVQIGALNTGTKLTSAVRSTVFLAAHPLCVALFAAWMIPGDRLRPARTAGLLLAFTGVVATFAEGLTGTTARLLGDSLIVLSAVLLGLRLVMLKRLVQQTPLFRALAWQAGLAVPLFALASLGFERGLWQPVEARHVGSLLYQGLVIAGFCFCVNAWLYEHHRASEVAAWTFTTPLWGVLFCALILGDAVTVWVALGVGLVALGIAVASREGRQVVETSR